MIIFPLMLLLQLAPLQSALAPKEVMKAAADQLKASGIDRRGPKKGDVIAKGQLRLAGKDLLSYGKGKTLVVKFYRGHWCPYCQNELKAYQEIHQQIVAKNAVLLAVTPDRQKYIDKVKKRFALSFDIIRDANNSLAKQLGIHFKLEKDLLGVYKNYGIDLKDSQGNAENMLALPSLYIIDSKGKIIHRFADSDYTKRENPQTVLSVLSSAEKR